MLCLFELTQSLVLIRSYKAVKVRRQLEFLGYLSECRDILRHGKLIRQGEYLFIGCSTVKYIIIRYR